MGVPPVCYLAGFFAAMDAMSWYLLATLTMSERASALVIVLA